MNILVFIYNFFNYRAYSQYMFIHGVFVSSNINRHIEALRGEFISVEWENARTGALHCKCLYLSISIYIRWWWKVFDERHFIISDLLTEDQIYMRKCSGYQLFASSHVCMCLEYLELYKLRCYVYMISNIELW